MVKPALPEVEMRPPAPADSTERRYIYSSAPEAVSQPEEGAPRTNRAAGRKRKSTLGRIALLVLISFLIVFYVWNKITVNRLLVEVNELETDYQKLQAGNDMLRAQINQKASRDRVATLAPKYGLVSPKQQPIWFDVPAEDLARVRGR